MTKSSTQVLEKSSHGLFIFQIFFVKTVLPVHQELACRVAWSCWQRQPETCSAFCSFSLKSHILSDIFLNHPSSKWFLKNKNIYVTLSAFNEHFGTEETQRPMSFLKTVFNKQNDDASRRAHGQDSAPTDDQSQSNTGFSPGIHRQVQAVLVLQSPRHKPAPEVVVPAIVVLGAQLWSRQRNEQLWPKAGSAPVIWRPVLHVPSYANTLTRMKCR